ncbi:MAG: DUF1949 domain-containing protein, partial [Gammaproteobacteria bacterium]|nr:DUF1949 domain-containing protein [Gammaproteobacteria bacterium]
EPQDHTGMDQSDDGEPRGTAGKPILNVLQHSGIGQCVIVVTRYFGGIKLGAGGLVRAYTKCASEALLQLESVEFIPRMSLQIETPYNLLASIEHWFEQTEIVVNSKEFTEQVRLEISVPNSLHEALLLKFNEIGNGKISVKE